MPPKKKGATKRKTKAAAKNKEEQEEEEEKNQEVDQVEETEEKHEESKPEQHQIEESKTVEEPQQEVVDKEIKSSNLINLKPNSKVISIKNSVPGTAILTEKQLREIRFNSGKTDQVNTLGIKEDFEKVKVSKESLLKVNYPGVRVNLGCAITPQDRMKRFGAIPKQNDQELQDKKRIREERFGIVSKESDLEKRKKRIQRFGEDSYFDALRQAR